MSPQETQELSNQLQMVLEEVPDFVDVQKNVLKPTVRLAARQGDFRLLDALTKSEVVREHFFRKASEHLIFLEEKFVHYLDSHEYLPDSYTAFRNRIGLVEENKSLVLSWPYKDCYLEGGMAKDKDSRDEIFLNPLFAAKDANRLLDPKAFTNFKDLDDQILTKEKIGTDPSLLIKGNNLFSIVSLLPKYRNKIDAIYIDPPYNTGGDEDEFKYNNTFKHSSWYTFIKNRLEVAKELLTEKGIIAIAIDHAELFYLGVIADEIFHRDNRLGVVTVVHKPEGRNQVKFFGTSTEYMLVYAKDGYLANFNNVAIDDLKAAEYVELDPLGKYKWSSYLRSGGGDDNLRVNKPKFWYPIYVAQDLSSVSLSDFDGATEVWPLSASGQERTWKTLPETFAKALENDRIRADKDSKGRLDVLEKYYEHEKGQVIKTHWFDKKYHAIHSGTKLLEKIVGKGKFSYPKSLYLVEDILKLILPKDGLVLDFFAGSGTTGHAVMNLNKADGGSRSFILCEQMDYAETVTKKRLKYAADLNSFGQVVIADLAAKNDNFMSKIDAAKTKAELEILWKDVLANGFISHRISRTNMNKYLEDTEFQNVEALQAALRESLDQNHLFVNMSEVSDRDWGLKETDIDINLRLFGSVI